MTVQDLLLSLLRAARHGFNLCGKLKRIEEQEKLVLNGAKHRGLALEIGSIRKEEQSEADSDSTWHKPCRKKRNTCGVSRRVLSVQLDRERSRDAAERQNCSGLTEDDTPLKTQALCRRSDGGTSPSEVVKKAKPKKRKRIHVK